MFKQIKKLNEFWNIYPRNWYITTAYNKNTHIINSNTYIWAQNHTCLQALIFYENIKVRCSMAYKQLFLYTTPHCNLLCWDFGAHMHTYMDFCMCVCVYVFVIFFGNVLASTLFTFAFRLFQITGYLGFLMTVLKLSCLLFKLVCT